MWEPEEVIFPIRPIMFWHSRAYSEESDVWASDINDRMKIAAAYAIAGLIEEKDLTPDHIIPNPFDSRGSKAVAAAVAEAARASGVAEK